MLAGFAKIHVPASGSVAGAVTFAVETMGHWDPRAEKHVVDSGSYTIMLCEHSASACESTALVL